MSVSSDGDHVVARAGQNAVQVAHDFCQDSPWRSGTHRVRFQGRLRRGQPVGLVSTALANAAMVVFTPLNVQFSLDCRTFSTHWTISSRRIRVGWSPMSRRKFSAPGSVRWLSCSLKLFQGVTTAEVVCDVSGQRPC